MQGGERINLKVVTGYINFKCKQTTPLKKLMDAFCNRRGISTSSVRFLYDGNTIHGAQTPAMLGMQDGDVINLLVEVDGLGMDPAPRKKARTASSSSPPATAAATLTLRGGVPYRASVVALWHDERLTDCTLCAEGVEFKVHRLVLASSSEYFLKLFGPDTHDTTHVLERIRPPVLKALLAFIYEGKCEIDEGLLTQVLEASARLMLDALKAACADAIAARLTPSNALDAWRLANTFTLPALEKAAQRCIEEPSSQDAPPEIPVLPEEILAHIGKQGYNPLEPRTTVYLSSASRGLRKLLTLELRQRLQEEHEAAAALCLKVGASCKALCEATQIKWSNKGLSVADLTTLGTLGSLLPALRELSLLEPSADPDGVQRLAEKLGAGALPGVTCLYLCMPVGDAGALAIAAALDRGALPRLMSLFLRCDAIGNAELAALTPALRRLPALEHLSLSNPLGDECIAALVAPNPPPAGALPPAAGGLKKLKRLNLNDTQITDAGCAALVEALDSGALPALKKVHLDNTPASAAAKKAVQAALARSSALTPKPRRCRG